MSISVTVELEWVLRLRLTAGLTRIDTEPDHE